MSLKPKQNYPIPKEILRVAQAAFKKENMYVRVVDAMGTFYHDGQFADLFPGRGQSAASSARLALVTVLQYTEGLSDRQAADAVRSRIDWKYVLGLELTDTGFDHTVLSEFRTRLAEGDAAFRLLESLSKHVAHILQPCRRLHEEIMNSPPVSMLGLGQQAISV